MSVRNAAGARNHRGQLMRATPEEIASVGIDPEELDMLACRLWEHKFGGSVNSWYGSGRCATEYALGECEREIIALLKHRWDGRQTHAIVRVEVAS